MMRLIVALGMIAVAVAILFVWRFQYVTYGGLVLKRIDRFNGSVEVPLGDEWVTEQVADSVTETLNRFRDSVLVKLDTLASSHLQDLISAEIWAEFQRHRAAASDCMSRYGKLGKFPPEIAMAEVTAHVDSAAALAKAARLATYQKIFDRLYDAD